jgi:hypothetical protein
MEPIKLIFKKIPYRKRTVFLETEEKEPVFFDDEEEYDMSGYTGTHLAKTRLIKMLKEHFTKDKLFKEQLKKFLIDKDMIKSEDFDATPIKDLFEIQGIEID